jgi:ureidoacrylate peracid hydrolase
MPTETSSAWREYALLLIDVQHDFWPDSVAATARGFPAAVERLLSSCRRLGIAVVHVHARFAPDGSDWIARYRLRGRIPCISGTEGAQPLPVAAPLPGEPVVLKHSFDAFLGTDLDALLRGAGRRFLLVAGLVTSTCVLLTAASATQLGYLVAVVADCCADHPSNHEQVLATYPFMFSVTRSSRLAEDRRHWDEDLLALAAPTHVPV